MKSVPCLLLFTKPARAGRVKTRLVGAGLSAERALAAVLRHPRHALAEEAPEELLGAGVAAGPLDARAVDVHHRRCDLPHDRRERQLDLGTAFRNGAGLGAHVAGPCGQQDDRERCERKAHTRAHPGRGPLPGTVARVVRPWWRAL